MDYENHTVIYSNKLIPCSLLEIPKFEHGFLFHSRVSHPVLLLESIPPSPGHRSNTPSMEWELFAKIALFIEGYFLLTFQLIAQTTILKESEHGI